MRPRFRFIGDVHNHKQDYVLLARKAEYSLQVGDMAFDYDFLNCLDTSRHKFIGGNHDNYDRINESPNNLGDFGIWKTPVIDPIFFVRGAFSIDRWRRSEGKDWWYEEQLTYRQQCEAVVQYVKEKPEIVVSHDCPSSVALHLFGVEENNSTRKMLQFMLEEWQPKLWLFGHHHKSRREKVRETKFVCLKQLEVFDI